MTDLSTRYLGLNLRNPLVASAGPLCESVGNIRRLEEVGISAVVLHSLFEEQIERESQGLHADLTRGEESFPEALSYFPELDSYRLDAEHYLEHIRQAKAAVDIPIIGSLNGTSQGGWLEYAKKIEDAGADALELNIYYIPTDPDMTGAEVEKRYLDLVKAVKGTVKIPVAVKLGPQFSAPANMAKAISEAGADALVLFNRFYQPDIDLENLEVVPNVRLSTPNTLRLRLRWVAILYGRIKADLAVTGGVHTGRDVLKAMMAGANVAMTTSALLKHGMGYARRVLREVEFWMEEYEYDSIEMMRGSMSQQAVADPEAFERANYLKVLGSYTPRIPAM